MGNTFKLLFFLRKPKKYESGPQPIYMRITEDGQRAEMTVQRECDPTLGMIMRVELQVLKKPANY